jgi:hypothetical protein
MIKNFGGKKYGKKKKSACYDKGNNQKNTGKPENATWFEKILGKEIKSNGRLNAMKDYMKIGMSMEGFIRLAKKAKLW